MVSHAEAVSLCRKWAPYCEVMILEFDHYRQFASQHQAKLSHTVCMDSFTEDRQAYLCYIVLVIGWDSYVHTIIDGKPLIVNSKFPKIFKGRTYMSRFITFDDEFDRESSESEDLESETVFDLDPLFLSDFCRLKSL